MLGYDTCPPPSNTWHHPRAFLDLPWPHAFLHALSITPVTEVPATNSPR